MSNAENLTYEEQLKLYDKQLEAIKQEKEKIALELENNKIKKELMEHEENDRVLEAMSENNALMKQNISVIKNMFYMVMVGLICNMLLSVGYALYSTDRLATAFEGLNRDFKIESKTDNSIRNHINEVESIDNSFNSSVVTK